MIGSEALACGAVDGGVQFVTGYPGSPSTETLEALLRVPGLRVEWAINEKSAFDAAFGASLAGVRSLVCLKSVGLNVALDSLMVANLAGGPGGFVILAGDDPGGWGSQNEEDSRSLAVAAEVPLLEPTCASMAAATMRQAFLLSERFHVPVVVRVTRALAAETVETPSPEAPPPPRQPAFGRDGERYNVLPIHVVEFHRRLQATLVEVGAEFEGSVLNSEQAAAEGRQGIVAAGHCGQKLDSVLGPSSQRLSQLRILRLSTLFPLPERRILAFLRQVERVLVLEEVAPVVERELRDVAQRAGLTLPILGRDSGHVPRSGELLAPDLGQALAGLLPDWSWATIEGGGRLMPSRQPLCEGCPYRPTFDALLAAMERHGGREAFIIAGETGCMVRSQLPPWELLDVKYAMGSSIGLAAGLARAGLPQTVVALAGDSALLHSGLGELIDAAQAGLDLLVVVLANGTTALSGGQPHPATGHDARGTRRRPVELTALMQAAGIDFPRVVDAFTPHALAEAFDAQLSAHGPRALIVRGACPQWCAEEGLPTSERSRGRCNTAARCEGGTPCMPC